MKYNDITFGQVEACVNRMGGMEQFLRFIGGQGRIVFNFLTLIRTVKLEAEPALTTSKEYFEEAGVKWMGPTFEKQFLGLEVPATPAVELAVRKLEQNSVDEPILAKLGGNAKAAVSHFRAFLAANRESSEYFVFYLEGKDGLFAVDADWYAGRGGWSVRARSVEAPHGWNAGLQVVSQV